MRPVIDQATIHVEQATVDLQVDHLYFSVEPPSKRCWRKPNDAER